MSGRISKYNVSDTSAAMQAKWQCGLYFRLSREDGDKMESDSITNQRMIIDRFLSRNPDLNIYDVYIDDGYTGSNFNRPNVIRLIDDIKSRKVDCLIVKDLSRFGRNYHETGQYIEVVFPLLKLRFISVNDSIDSYKNPASIKNSSVSFKNVMNDEYGRDISNKVKSSFNMKRKKGQFIGSFASYGYMKDPEDHHKLIIDTDAAETVKLIYQMFLSGISIYNICIKLKQMGVTNPTDYKIKKGLNDNRKCFENGGWSTNTVRRMLKNELYIGDLIQRKLESVSHKVRKCIAVPKDKQIVVRGNHEPIIDFDTFNKAQLRFKRDIWQPKNNENESVEYDAEKGGVFVGYIKCADCGRAMQRTGTIEGKNNLYYFICSTHLQWKQCARHATRVTKLSQTVLTIIQKYVAMAVEMDDLLDVVEKLPTDNLSLSRYKKEIKAKEVEKAKLVKFLKGLYPDFKDELINKEQYLQFKNEYETKITAIDSVLASLNKQIVDQKEGEKANDFIDNFKKYQNITMLTRDVIVELIEMIYVENNGGIKIVFNFQDSFKKALERIEAYKSLVQADNTSMTAS